MAVPVLNERQDYGGKLSMQDRRQFIDYGGAYRGTFSMGVTRSAQKRSVSFSRAPEKARAIYDFLDASAYDPGYFKWRAVGDTEARYWTVEQDSLEMSEDAFGRYVVSVSLIEYRSVGGVV